MRILVSNIGSTSFKFRLFDFADGSERELASGGVDRIGAEAAGTLTLAPAGADATSVSRACADHGEAIGACLDALADAGVLPSADALDAVAFKAVFAGEREPVALVDDGVLEAMAYYACAAPAHNPPYLAAMRRFAEALPGTPLVACFETGFHRTIPPRRRRYAVPREWETRFGIRRYGYHGASHRYIAERTAEVAGRDDLRLISCHLGGSSSVCAIRDGASVANSFGFSPQSGLPQSSRAGEFDPFALAVVAREAQMTLEAMLEMLGSAGGLKAMCGAADMRDVESAADAGDADAALALAAYVTAVRDWVGACLVELGGADAVVFTGGIGQHCPRVRRDVCRDLAFAGIRLDEAANAAGSDERRIDADDSPTAVWVMPTNEELIVARQARDLLKQA